MRDPYQVLGVSKSSSQDEIKAAYRKLAKELHPDRHTGNAKMADRFKEVSAAYSLIGDPKARKRFDAGEINAAGQEQAAQGFHQAYTGAGGDAEFFTQFGGAGGGGMEDLFADLFGGFRRGGEAGGTRRRGFQRRGSDRRFALTVGFLEAARGTTRRLTLPAAKTLDVRIPAGVEDGQQIRLKEQGDPGVGGGPAGDALIEVAITPHPLFERQGRNILIELPVTLPEAVLGARIQAPTIHGDVTLTVPKGANSGTTLRLKGRGIKGPKGKAAGDQLVRLKVVLPDRIDPELEALVKAWAERHDYDVRAKLKVD